MSRIFKQTHGVFNDHFVIEAEKVDNLFYDPRFDNREVHFPHVDLFVKVLREFYGLQEFELLVGESTVLVGRRALEEPSVAHGNWFSRDTVLERSTAGER